MTDLSKRSILFVSEDLVFLSRLRGIADPLSYDVTFHCRAPGVERAVEELSPDVLIVDLETPGLDIGSMMRTLPNATRPQVLAYAPHVYEGRLNDARTAGCDYVLARGQFDLQVNDLLKGSVKK